MRNINSAPALRPPAEVAAEMRRKKGELNGKTVDADAPVPSLADMAATISKNMPLRRVAVRRRVMSGAASLSNGHYGHVGIGIKIGKEGGQHFVVSVPSPLFQSSCSPRTRLSRPCAFSDGPTRRSLLAAQQIRRGKSGLGIGLFRSMAFTSPSPQL
jgi:hypothetical protein